MIRHARTTTILAATVLLVLGASTAPAQIQDSGKQKCINGVNKGAAKLAKTIRKSLASCAKTAEGGGLPGASSLEACTFADISGKIGKSVEKIQKVEAKSCSPAPDFGFTSAAIAATAVDDEERALGDDLFGVDFQGNSTADGSRCRSRVAKDAGRLGDAILKAFLACKKTGLKGGTITSQGALEGCFGAIGDDEKGKISKATEKLLLDALGECDPGELGSLFPGMCGAAAGVLDFGSCVSSRVRCHNCLMLNAADGLDGDCDDVDDSMANGSCGGIGTTTTSTTSTSTTTTSSTTSTTLVPCASTSAPTCAGQCPAGQGCFDQGGSCACEVVTTTTSTTTTSTTSTSTTTSTTLPGPPDWPADPGSYVAGPISYLNSLSVPAVTGGIADCCYDFGAISKDFIEGGTNNIDNALAVLAGALGGLGIDLQQILSDSLTDGSLVLILDHQDLDFVTLPDPFFALVQLTGAFDVGTTFVEADAGIGEFLINTSSFVGATGEPSNFHFPSLMDVGDMTAGPFTLSLTLPLGFLTLDAELLDAGVMADHGTITASGIPYTNGALWGYVLVDTIFDALNGLLNSPTCDCLGHTGDIYSKQPDGSWAATCQPTVGTCVSPADDLCIQLGAGFLAGGFCDLLPGVLQGQADIDLNSDPTVYEGLSVGLGFTGTTGTITGLTP